MEGNIMAAATIMSPAATIFLTGESDGSFTIPLMYLSVAARRAFRRDPSGAPPPGGRALHDSTLLKSDDWLGFLTRSRTRQANFTARGKPENSGYLCIRFAKRPSAAER